MLLGGIQNTSTGHRCSSGLSAGTPPLLHKHYIDPLYRHMVSPPSPATHLSVFPATPTVQHNFPIQLGSSTTIPTRSTRTLV